MTDPTVTLTRRRLTWRDRLDPFAADYAALVRRAEARVHAMSDADLAKLDAATRRPTQTNCGWSSYQVAPILRDIVRIERQQRRVKHREERKAARHD